MKKRERGLLRDARLIALLLLVLFALVAIYVYPQPPVTVKINADIEGSALSRFLEKELGRNVGYAEGYYTIIPGVSKERLSEVLKTINGSIAKKADGASDFSGAGINGNLRYGLDLVGGTSLQLKLEGTLVGIKAPVNESEVSSSLYKALDTEVNPYKKVAADVYVYEIRKTVTKEQLREVLTGLNGSIAERPDGTDYFEEGVTPEMGEEVREIIETKLNMLGLASTTVRPVGSDLMIVDLAGVDIKTAEDLVGKPGKFEIRIQTNGTGGEISKGEQLAEIANITAHVVYGSEGIQSVRMVPERTSEKTSWGAPFTLTEKGAKALREAALKYDALDYPKDHELVMLLDNEVVYSGPLAPSLTTELRTGPVFSLISETGVGNEGLERAQELIIHLKAGALPVNVKVMGSGEVPAYLGAKFKTGAVIAGLLAFIFVALVVFLRYREKKIVLPMLFCLLSEVLLLLGFAAVIKWELDLPSIAGIIAVIGTGVDQLVIITDGVLSGGQSSASMYRRRITFAFGIIFVSTSTTIVAMLALAFMALGTLRGFAIVTIVGLLIGIIITRPAYARVIATIV